jgi:hypothetical protein
MGEIMEISPKTLEAKWLDPECWDGCQSLKWKQRAETAEKKLAEIQEYLERLGKTTQTAKGGSNDLLLVPTEPSVIEQAFRWFCEQAGKTKAYQLTAKRKTMAEARWKELRAAHSYDDSKKLFANAIRGLLEDDFMVREGYVDWEQVFQSPEKFQRRIERYENPREQKRRIL